MSLFKEIEEKVSNVLPVSIRGKVADVVGLTIECEDFSAPVGAQCEIECRHSGQRIEAEVVGFRKHSSILMPYSDIRGFAKGDSVRLLRTRQVVPVGDELVGRIFNARGQAVDGKPQPFCPSSAEVFAAAPDAFERPRIQESITTGVKVIDGLFTCGKGQRMGIFAGSGVGKSTLLSMITRNTDADIVVLGLIGERGRELREFLENDLGEEGLKRAVVVCETSDRPPLLRVKAAFTATAIAEYFRSQGKNVMLLMDSLTRMAMAQREIGLSVGEPPTTKGYPPSVFNMMPRLLERSGADQQGSITAFYTVLVEGDDTNEPIADTVRGILDGHIWLMRDLAHKGHYPAIGIDHSVSRLMNTVAGEEHKEAAMRLRKLYTTYQEAEDLINIGAYRQGSNPRIDESIGLHESIMSFLQQKVEERYNLDTTIELLKESVALTGAPGNKPKRVSHAVNSHQQRPSAAMAKIAGAMEAKAGGAGAAQGGGAGLNERNLGRLKSPAAAQQGITTPSGQERISSQQLRGSPGQQPVHAPRKPA